VKFTDESMTSSVILNVSYGGTVCSGDGTINPLAIAGVIPTKFSSAFYFACATVFDMGFLYHIRSF
jgi:hypothetical protein